jgi:hypothetical protein
MIRMLRNIRKRTIEGAQERLELIVWSGMVILVLAYLFFTYCPRIEWCLTQMIDREHLPGNSSR